MSTLYTTQATAFNGRDGRVTTEDGAVDLALVRPPELGGKGEAGTNPEQLFACGYAACFGATLQALSRPRKLSPSRNEVKAEIGLVKRTEGGFILSAKLQVLLAGISRNEAEELVEEAHRTCPYSNSIRQTIDVEIETIVV